MAGEESLPYDLDSVMHYPALFSRNGNLTIETLDPALQSRIGKTELSDGDVNLIKKIYNC